MSKELEALKEARNHRHEKEEHLVIIDIDYLNKCIDGLETALKKQEQDQKKLKAFEIIKEKRVDLTKLYTAFRLYDLNYYNHLCYKELTQEEYELLKEVLL